MHGSRVRGTRIGRIKVRFLAAIALKWRDNSSGSDLRQAAIVKRIFFFSIFIYEAVCRLCVLVARIFIRTELKLLKVFPSIFLSFLRAL